MKFLSAEWAGFTFADFPKRTREAGRAIARMLRGQAPDPFEDPEKVIMTALLIFACRKERAWIPEVTEFEALLGAIRASPALLQHFPGDVQQGPADTLRRVWSAYVGKVRAIVGGDIPIHRLVAGDPGSNPLADVLALPGGALDEVEDHDIATTSHCTQLTRGTADESRLLLVMLQGVVGFAAEQPLSFKAAETLLRTTLVEPADDRLAEAWLDANAPHQHHSGLMALWHDFWEERTSTLHDDSGADDYRRFLATWLPVIAPAQARAKAPAKAKPPAKAISKA